MCVVSAGIGRKRERHIRDVAVSRLDFRRALREAGQGICRQWGQTPEGCLGSQVFLYPGGDGLMTVGDGLMSV